MTPQTYRAIQVVLDATDRNACWREDDCTTWDYKIVRQACKLAGMETEWEAKTFENFDKIFLAALTRLRYWTGSKI